MYGGMRVLLKNDEILKYINDSKYKFISNVEVRASDGTILLYVYKEKVSNRVKPGFTSARQLTNLKKRVANKYSRRVEIVFTQDESQSDLESAFYQLLNRKFDDKIISLVISSRNVGIIDAYMEVTSLTEALKQDIAQHFETILTEGELKLGWIDWLDSPCELPTLVALLRVLKEQQPIGSEQLIAIMQDPYPSISYKWLKNKLDQLRKKGLVMRQRVNGTYALTSDGLHAVPSGARKTSSDIDRALVLGRKRW